MSLAAVSCGDDDDSSDAAGSGGTGGGKTGGTGGASGKGGSGGTAGKGGAGGGGDYSSAMCITDTTAILKGQPGALSADCIKCICDGTANAKTVMGCNTSKNGACWQFIGCYATKGCMPGTDEAKCVQDNCGDFLTDGLAGAQKVGPLIQMGTCMKTCAADSGDAGTHDAGF